MLEINDEELRAIDKVHKELNTKYYKRPFTSDIGQMLGIKNDIKERFAKVGFEVEVILRTDPITGAIIPDVEFTGRTDKTLETYLKTETDWERREHDLRKTSVEELKKSSQNIHLLE